MPTNSPDVVVIGGGIIGLSLAWRLRLSGASVTVLEKGCFSPADPTVPGQATWAAGGMLAPLLENTSPSLLALGLTSAKLYPAFCQELSAASGSPVDLEGEGSLRLAATEDDAGALEEQFRQQRQLDSSVEWLVGSDVASLEPAIQVRAIGGILSPSEKQVQPRVLRNALAAACVLAGVNLQPDANLLSFRTSGRRITAVETPAGVVDAGEVALCAGAWTGNLGKLLDLEIPVTPLRGQLLAIRAPGVIRHPVFVSGGCLIPWRDGRILVGGTVEDVGFDADPSDSTVRSLRTYASAVVPVLGDVVPEATWTGFRPAVPDALPILGPGPDWDNVHVATGHFKKGILLAPITAQLMSGWILDRRSDPLLESFAPSRFASAQSADANQHPPGNVSRDQDVGPQRGGETISSERTTNAA